MVFLLIGLQLPVVLHGIRSIPATELFISAGQLASSLILLRLLWVLPATYIGYYARQHFFHQAEERPSLRATFVLDWTGMRGVVSLAAALALPSTLANGEAFAQRDALISLTSATISVTLILQGLTLPPLIRFLKLPSSDAQQAEEREARRRMLSATVKRLRELRESDESNPAPSTTHSHTSTSKSSIHC
jgi:monovalent cation/hydrogen antiporter